ncbi:hypothetical protein Tco_0824180 [Tanacetum coccineum]|uniref:Uncharacterized protein n=1 Tax=Tanacetum coccineum TaxID=301880 RepID=A0ABQ5AL19_9ASTR
MSMGSFTRVSGHKKAKHELTTQSRRKELPIHSYRVVCFEMFRVLRDLILHRSSINNSASLSNKFRGFYFNFKFDISGLLHQSDHNNSRQNTRLVNFQWEVVNTTSLSMVYEVFYVLDDSSTKFRCALYMSNVRKSSELHQIFRICSRYECWFEGKLIQKLHQKGVYEESFSRHAA